ncbi:hypothetical protein LJC58_04755, partial [Lachnospiraceae bacterium OttesenSCG-928-D06]|nr:hypothetical protein [Lachnospiraceae bacterium OttesenSCG-928-D06]
SWVPIGKDNSHIFKGTFNGSGHKISGLYINSSSTYQGLFGFASGGTIKNLGVTGSIVGGDYTGGIVGYSGSVINNCYYVGSVAGKDYVGGIAGYNANKISDVYHIGDVDGINYVGGIVGYNGDGVSKCYQSGNVSGEQSVGGIAGYVSSSGSVERSTSLGLKVSGTEDVGRVAGESTGTLQRNFARKDQKVQDRILSFNDGNSINGAIILVNDTTAMDVLFGAVLGWDVSDTWTVSEENLKIYCNLPTLRSINATQNPTLQGPTYKVDFTVQLDDSPYASHGITFALYQDNVCKYTGSGTDGDVAFEEVSPGTYKIYANSKDTGETVTVTSLDAEVELDYYTVNFDVEDDEDAENSTISASYNGETITSGDVVLSGKELVITAVGAGADEYTYAWSGDGTNSETDAELKISNLSEKVDAICTVTGIMDTYTATLTVNRDGAAYMGHGKMFALCQLGEAKVTGSGTNGTITFLEVPDGSYNIYADGKDTGKTIEIVGEDGTAELNYYTVKYSLKEEGDASGSTITASYNGESIDSGAVVISGKELVITATGQGTDSYLYTWSGEGANGEIGSLLTIASLSGKVDISCTVTGITGIFSYDITVTNDGNGTGRANFVRAAQGTEVTLTAIPNPGYQFKEWVVVSGGINVTNHKFIMPMENVEVKAIFVKETDITDVGDGDVSGGDAENPSKDDGNENGNNENGSNENGDNNSNKVILPQMISTNYNGMTLENWEQVKDALNLIVTTEVSLNAEDEQTISLLKVNIQRTDKYVPSDVIEKLSNNKNAALHLFLGSGNAVTFYSSADFSNYRGTSFAHKTTDVQSGNKKERQIKFEKEGNIGTEVLLHFNLPNSTPGEIAKVYKVVNGERLFLTNVRIQGNNNICFFTSSKDEYVIVYQ